MRTLKWPEDFKNKDAWYKFLIIAEKFNVTNAVMNRYYFKTKKDTLEFYNKIKHLNYNIELKDKYVEIDLRLH